MSVLASELHRSIVNIENSRSSEEENNLLPGIGYPFNIDCIVDAGDAEEDACTGRHIGL